MPLIKFAEITPHDRWRNILAAIFKGSLGHHIELDLSQARNLIRNIQLLLPSDAKAEVAAIDQTFADLQAQGVQTVIFSLYPTDTVPPI